MTDKYFGDFLQHFEAECDKEGIRDNSFFVEISEFIHCIVDYLNEYLNVGTDILKGYKKILPVLFCLKAVKRQLHPIKITINGLIHYLTVCDDEDIIEFSWSNYQIEIVSKIIITCFKEKCHIDLDI